jgi:hypothetical protein
MAQERRQQATNTQQVSTRSSPKFGTSWPGDQNPRTRWKSVSYCTKDGHWKELMQQKDPQPRRPPSEIRHPSHHVIVHQTPTKAIHLRCRMNVRTSADQRESYYVLILLSLNEEARSKPGNGISNLKGRNLRVPQWRPISADSF